MNPILKWLGIIILVIILSLLVLIIYLRFTNDDPVEAWKTFFNILFSIIPGG